MSDERTSGPEDGRRGHEHILLVEDEERVRRSVSIRLASLGYSVIEAESGVGALDLLSIEDLKIDLLFSDIVLPGSMSGFHLLKKAREMQPGLKAILTTGHADEMLRHADGARCPILMKPYRLFELSEAVRTALDAPLDS